MVIDFSTGWLSDWLIGWRFEKIVYSLRPWWLIVHVCVSNVLFSAGIIRWKSNTAKCGANRRTAAKYSDPSSPSHTTRRSAAWTWRGYSVSSARKWSPPSASSNIRENMSVQPRNSVVGQRKTSTSPWPTGTGWNGKARFCRFFLSSRTFGLISWLARSMISRSVFYQRSIDW